MASASIRTRPAARIAALPVPCVLHPPHEPLHSLGAQVAAQLVAGVQALRANACGMLDARTRRDPEFVHQARVAVRRMRAALFVFGVPLARAGGGQAVRDVRRALRGVGRELGIARDWDVVQSGLLPARRAELEAAHGRAPVLKVFRRAQLARARANARVRRYVSGEDFADVLAQAEALAARLDGGHPEGATQAGRHRAGRAAMLRALECQRRTVLDQGSRLAKLDAEQRHRLRIEAKRLRYATELCAPLLAGRRLKAWLRPLHGLQDALGGMNDARTLVSLAGPLGEDASLGRYLSSRLAHGTRASLPQAAAMLMAWQLAGVPWKS